MKIFLDDINCRQLLQPFSLTRHVSELRVGITTIRQKWEMLTSGWAEIVVNVEHAKDAIKIESNIIPTVDNFKKIIELSKANQKVEESDLIKVIIYPWHLLQFNEYALKYDFDLITRNKKSLLISNSNNVVNEKMIFIEEGAIVEGCFLNATSGPIYIGKNVEIMEGSMIRGPFSIGDNSVVKMGAKIYGTSSIGSKCVVAGEIKNSIIFDYSNKAHDGYLGDSVIGSWCNWGAGTSNSNVKNSGSDVFYTLYKGAQPVNAGKKGGLLMGDYSRCAINTSFNTGTVVGICCNVFNSSELTQKFIDNFTWRDENYEFEKAIKHIKNWKEFKGHNLSETEIKGLEKIYLVKNN